MHWPASELEALLREVNEFHQQAMSDLEAQYRRALGREADPVAREYLDEALRLSKANVLYVVEEISRAAMFYLGWAK
jgi:hypothetical protein